MTTDVAARDIAEGVPGVRGGAGDGVDGDPCVGGVDLALLATEGRVDAPPVGDSATEPAALQPASPITSVAAATPTVSTDPGRRRSIVYRQWSNGAAAGRGEQPDT